MNLNFHDYLYYSNTFLLKFSSLWVSKKRNNKESMICLMPKPNQSFFVYRIQSKEKIFYRKRDF